MHIELTEMLKCPEPHREEFLVLSTGEMAGRMVRSGLVGCPVCRQEYPVTDGIVDFAPRSTLPAGDAAAGARAPDAATLQALLDLGGPGGIVVLLGDAARQAPGLASLMGGIHFVGVNAPADLQELPILSLLRATRGIPLRSAMARGVVVGATAAAAPWLAEAQRVLLRGRRYVLETEGAELPAGIAELARGDGVIVGEKA
jgi:uncharacterized protein YbaR (Trm112 family)